MPTPLPIPPEFADREGAGAASSPAARAAASEAAIEAAGEAPSEVAGEADREALVRELSMHAMTALRALQHQAQRAFEPLGLRPSQVLVLEMIQRGLDQPKLLADGLGTVQSAVTAVLNELQEVALIDRTTDPEDRRRVRVSVTEHGRAMLEQAGRVWLQAAEATLADVGLADLRAAARVVRTLTRETA